MTDHESANPRRAIEALRAGVPNRDAVQALGCEQPEIEQRFREQLRATREGLATGEQPQGLLIMGDFGTGKSHLLEHLHHIALDANCVSSKVVISKETPLHDPAKLFRTAIRRAVVPGCRGNALTEITTRLRPGEEAYEALETWAHDATAGLNSRFAASLFLFQKAGPATELGDRILSFWSGDRIGKGEIKKYLREYGERSTYSIEPIKERELALQRFRFVPRLAVAAGYSGWAILVDEVELIGMYSPLQRGKSYAELARWMGKIKSEANPGLCTVFAIMSNFQAAVLEEKKDLDLLPERLRAKGLDEVAKWAERGMAAIRRDSKSLRRPTQDTIQQARDKVREIYASACAWEPPANCLPGDRAAAAMRGHVRKWITEWDLMRLYPEYKPNIREYTYARKYPENQELEHSSEGDSDQDSTA